MSAKKKTKRPTDLSGCEIKDPSAKVTCDNCDWAGTRGQLERQLYEVHHLTERLDEGSVVPAGECPECGCFAYLETGESPASHFYTGAPKILHALEALIAVVTEEHGGDKGCAICKELESARAVVAAAKGGAS